MLPLFLLSILLGNEIPLSRPVVEPAPFMRNAPGIASNGTIFFAAWYDQINAGIRGVRLDERGQLIDQVSIRIASGAGKPVAVASDGQDFVVAYACSAYPGSVCLAHVFSDTGVVEQGGRIEPASSFAIASNGHGYVMTYLPDIYPSSSRPLQAIAIARDGSILGKSFELPATPYPAAIASNGTNYYVVWSSYSALFGALISDREVLKPAQQLTTFTPGWGAAAFGWSVASNGDSFVVVWQQNIGVTDRHYVTENRSRFIARDGTLGADHRIASEPERAWYPSAAWNGREYVVSYTYSVADMWPLYFQPEEADIHQLSLDANGALTKSPSVVAARSGREAMASIASNGATTVTLWEHDVRAGGTQIEAKSDDAPQIVSNAIAWQQNLAGTGRVIAWEEIIGAEQRHQLRMQRVPADGDPVIVQESVSDQLNPAAGGQLIAWLENGHVFARRLGNDNALPIGDVLSLGESSTDARIAIAAVGARHLVVWESPDHHIVGARILDGVLLDTKPFAISHGSAREWNATIATNGDSFAVAWNRDYTGGICVEGCMPPASIQSASVERDGVVGPTIEVAPMDARDPRLVWDGSDYVLFWTTRPSALFARHLGSPARKIRDGALPLGVTWTGSEYLVAFASGGYLFAGRVDAALNLQEVASVTTIDTSFRDAVLSPAVLAYPTKSNFDVSRAVVRIIGEDASPAASRRRTSR
ncbi:MAG TPA: hypothetical protein VJ901_18020 [Thermoanaerobaculia bacterium]|nr:hypothetical protein [Thermoanaerobaculia bacterium]